MEGATGDAQHETSLEPTAPEMTVRDRETALLQAVSEGCWQRVIILVQRGVSPSQRDTTLLQVAGSQQWGYALDVLHLGVSPEARDAIFLQAAEREQWSCVSDVLHLGVSRPVRDDVFLRAVRERRWDCAGKLFDLGVSSEKRDFVFSDVVGSGDARLTSRLITAGVSPALQDRVLRGAVEQGRVTFLVELLRLMDAPSVSAAVLETAVSLRDWTLVRELVKLHKELQLGQGQMDAVCWAAAAGGRWDCALQLLERGTHPNREMVDAALRSGSDVLQRFLGIYPREAMPPAVKKLLIEGAIGLDSTDTLQSLLLRFGASDEETVEAFESAVNCKNKKALKVLVGCRNGNGQLLKQWCVSKSGEPSEDFKWVCLTLMWENKRDIVLGLDIALAIGNCSVVKATLFDNATSWKVVCMFLRKVHYDSEWLFKNIALEMAESGPCYRRTLFLMSVRLGDQSTAVELYGEGVSLRDVRYALGVACSTPSDELPDGEMCRSKEQRLQGFFRAFDSNLEVSKSMKLLKMLVKESLATFVSRGEEEDEFLTWFKVYCQHEETVIEFGFSVFRQAYKAAVAWDREKCFVDSLTLVLLCNKNDNIRVAQEMWYFPSGSFAFNEYVSVNYTKEATVSIDFALKMQKFSFVSQTVLVKGNPEMGKTVLKRVFLKGGWPVFDLLFESKDPTVIARMCKYGQEFMHCLWETIVKTSKTGTVRVGAARVLDKWLVFMCPTLESRDSASHNFTRELGSDVRLGERSDTVLRLAEFSCCHGYQSLALFLAAGVGADGVGLMWRVLAPWRRAVASPVASNVVFELACYAVETLKDFAVAAVLIKHLPMSVLRSTHCYMGHATQELRPKDVDGREALTAALLRESVPEWFFLRQLIGKNFVAAQSTLVLCAHSQECVDVLVDHAAKSSRWDLVGKFMSQACRPDLLQLTLKTALLPWSCRKYMDATFLRRLVNLAGTARESGESPPRPESYLDHVVHHRKPALVLAHCLVSLGASAQHRKVMRDRECPLEKASACQQLQLVKLFHRSGVTSNCHLFKLAADSHDSNFCWYPRDDGRRPSHVDPKEVIQSYLSFAASCPLSLQDLCRNAVSSSLGGQPGYMQRVQALPVPEAVKEFILFSDLVQEESTV